MEQTDRRDNSGLTVPYDGMGIEPEDKYVMEGYCRTAERFMKVLEFYKHSSKEKREYFDSCFRKMFRMSFGEYFSPLIKAESKRGRRRTPSRSRAG
jgi:hypothetical protein